MSKNSISRREFIKQVGAGTAAGIGTWLLTEKAQPASASAEEGKETWGMLIDLTRCVGCNSCALACKESNGHPEPDKVPDELSPESFTYVEPVEVQTASGRTEIRYVKRQCMHCLDAACVSACPAAAMYNSGEGPVVYRAVRCLGCRYCEVGCPFGIPRFEWDKSITATINKCWMCYERLQDGEIPACAAACPSGAIHFGKRSQLLAYAHGLIDNSPEHYLDHIYGESEVGGTSMLYLSDLPFEELGFPADLPKYAPPQQTEKIMSALPFVLGGMATLMTGTALYTHRTPSTEGEE